MKEDYNLDRYEGLPLEFVFADVILMEVKEFIQTVYATLVRFYQPVIQFEILEEMSQDLFEISTSMVVNRELSPHLVKLLRLQTRYEENELT